MCVTLAQPRLRNIAITYRKGREMLEFVLGIWLATTSIVVLSAYLSDYFDEE
jgi:hypothetical protein